MPQNHPCVERTSRSNVTVKEKGRRANFTNKGRQDFDVVKVDGCLITEGEKADYIVSKVGVGSVIVELKGKDVPHACKQVMRTLDHADCADWLGGRTGILIVCSRYPAYDSVVARAETQARRRGVRLKTTCGGGDFNIEELLPA